MEGKKDVDERMTRIKINRKKNVDKRNENEKKA